MANLEYTAVIEEGPDSWGAYVPDLPICVAAGATREEVEQLIREAIELWVESTLESGEPLPTPHTYALPVTVSVGDAVGGKRP